MVKLTLALSIANCRHAGCNRPASMFGVCREHEPADIRREFVQAEAAGLAAHHPPACFKDADEWHSYIVAAVISGGPSMRDKTTPINYCRDCTPKHRNEMVCAGRCIHPETVFVKEQSGDTVGVALVDKRLSHVWEQAVMGMAGPVVSMPSGDAVDKAIAGLELKRPVGRPPRGRGRPRKDEAQK